MRYWAAVELFDKSLKETDVLPAFQPVAFLKVTEVRRVQSTNADEFIHFKLEGNVIEARAVHPLKTPQPNSVTPSTMVTLVSFVHE